MGKEVSIVTINALSLIAMVFAAYGSTVCVDSKKRAADFSFGGMLFLVGNSTNVAVGLHIGDLSLVVAQVGLVWFTLPMYKNKLFSVACSVWFLALVAALGVANEFHFTANWIGVAASAMAVYGAWAMSKFKWNIMNWMWVCADILFVYIAILNGLLGLGILAVIFIYHGTLRILGYRRDGLFTFIK